ncbi:hypothetical protein D3C78_1526190 [compost metagenome]
MLQVGAGLDESAARFGHLGAVHRHIAVHEQIGRFAEVTAFQHRRPEQAVEINDVLADKVIQLGGGVLAPELVKVQIATLVAQVFE